MALTERRFGHWRWRLALPAAVVAAAFVVAAAIERPPADFAALSPIAVVRDGGQRPLWAIRLAGAAHQLAADAVAPVAPPAEHAYQLWLAAPEGPHSLGLLPTAGRKVIAEIPAIAARLAGAGELIVTLEPARGSETRLPSGPVVFRSPFAPSS